ncbi:nucleotidyltransferase domain-containing protein [bacterium]|nr:nucleotidyltransferase domain-containing protein [bacterium]
MAKQTQITEQSLTKSILKIIDEPFQFAILLGSALTDRFHKESDIDIAIMFNKEPIFAQLAKWKNLLYEEFDKEWDLVVLNKIDPIYAHQVLETGRPLVLQDQSAYNLWRSTQMSLYPDFKSSRKVIEDSLLNRKKYV